MFCSFITILSRRQEVTSIGDDDPVCAWKISAARSSSCPRMRLYTALYLLFYTWTISLSSVPSVYRAVATGLDGRQIAQVRFESLLEHWHKIWDEGNELFLSRPRDLTWEHIGCSLHGVEKRNVEGWLWSMWSDLGGVSHIYSKNRCSLSYSFGIDRCSHESDVSNDSLLDMDMERLGVLLLLCVLVWAQEQKKVQFLMWIWWVQSDWLMSVPVPYTYASVLNFLCAQV
jgi:hypothetical protein